jgi:hypothetical protein
MKRLNHIGKVIIAVGVLALFRMNEGFNGFGGYVDNTWKIVFVSLVIMVTGFSIVLFSIKRKP